VRVHANGHIVFLNKFVENVAPQQATFAYGTITGQNDFDMEERYRQIINHAKDLPH
jgi:hypothetical protein